MMILRIEPSIPLMTPKGAGNAHFLESIGEEHDYLWTVFQDNGEIWTWRNREVRARENITLGRTRLDSAEKENEDALKCVEFLEQWAKKLPEKEV